MFVRPAEGRAVRDPDTRVLLAAEGEEKPDTRFWRRRVRDKDVLAGERSSGSGAVAPEPDLPPALPAPADASALAEEH